MALTNQKQATVIGVDMVHAAILTTDPLNVGALTPTPPVYTNLEPLPNVRTASISSADAAATEYFDNSPKYTVLSKGAKTLTIARAALSNEEAQKYLGLQVDADGITLEGKASVPPYIALGFRRLKQGQDGKEYHEYYWLLKGILRMNDDPSETRQATVTVQPRTLTGEFIERQADNQILIKAATDDDGVDPEVFEDWFTLGTLNKLYSAV